MANLSIIVPVYQVEKYLEKCIQSILWQNFTDFELILVDDGSFDSSGKICDRFAERDPRIKVIHKANEGVASARNFGLGVVSTEYVVFVDADDELISKKYLDNLMENLSVDYVVGGFTNRFVEREKVSDNISCLVTKSVCGDSLKKLPEKFYTYGFMHSCCAKRYKMSIIRQFGITFPNIRVSEDSMFNIEYLKHISSWKIINECGYAYIHRYNAGNATSKFIVSDIDIYVKLYHSLRLIGVKRSIVKNTLYAQYYSCLNKVYNMDMNWSGRKMQMKTILDKPTVRYTLFFTRRNVGEWLSGILLASCNQRLIDLWKRRNYK